MSENNNFLISPDFNVHDWINARDSDNWEKMVEIFHDRLNGRFFEPINLIMNNQNTAISDFCGFSIIALDCLIIETLKQFYDGTNETNIKHATSFRDFFRQSEYFLELRTNKKASIFYKHFRCGLLHQAQTKGKSLINTKESVMVKTISDNIEDGLIINRNMFHKALLNEFDDYKAALLAGLDSNKRINFKNKMNFICNLTTDTKRTLSWSGAARQLVTFFCVCKRK